MSRTRGGRARGVWLPLVGLALGLATGVAIVAARSNDSASSSGGAAIAHVHGLGINPADDRLYVATHHGVFVVDDTGDAQRVGEGTQDTMGFTVVGADRFLASGHPDVSSRQASGSPLLGLIESRDGGETWRTLSLEGVADFHSLVAAHGRVYGWNSSTGNFMVSPDGKQWETRSRVALLSFAVDPADPDRVVASDQQGLLVSGDGGRTWQPEPGPAVAFLSWSDQGLWAAQIEGQVLESPDGGATWQPRRQLPGKAAALLASGDTLYAATQEAGIYRSSDGGRSWRTLYGPS